METTALMEVMRDDLRQFTMQLEVPPHLRTGLVDILHAQVPGLSDEQLGWAVLSVSAAVLQLVGAAMTAGEDPGVLINPRLFGILASAGEALIAEHELAEAF